MPFVVEGRKCVLLNIRAYEQVRALIEDWDPSTMRRHMAEMADTQHAGRVGASLLNSVGLDDLVAESIDDYIEIAVALSRDVERLAELRGELRRRLLSSALCRPKRFANSVDAAYRTMWRKWCESDSAGPGHPERVEKN